MGRIVTLDMHRCGSIPPARAILKALNPNVMTFNQETEFMCAGRRAAGRAGL